MKRALLIGIDDYERFSGLDGCVNDVEALEPLLARNEDDSPNFQCQTRTSTYDDVSRDGLLGDVHALFGTSADVALLYYAGHGGGNQDGSDVTLVACDGTEATPGIAMSELMAKVRASPVREIVIVLDCCFSGGAGGVPQLGLADAALREGVSILTASRSDEPAAETESHRGAFSVFLCGGLDGGAADTLGKVSVAGLYAYLDEAFGPWDQRPAFKANLQKLEPLRICRAPVASAEMRKLPELFPAAEAEFSLDPSFEPTADPKDADNEAVLGVLQHFRAARLVEPVNAEHMYFAAMESKACRLTALGRLYWHMASENRL